MVDENKPNSTDEDFYLPSCLFTKIIGKQKGTMAKEKFFTTIAEPTARKVQRDAKVNGITDSAQIASIVQFYYQNLDIMNAILTTYREVRACRITADATAEKVYGEAEWQGFREAIDSKVGDEMEKLFG